MCVFKPWRYVERVDAISLEALAERGITTILFDRDNTVVPGDKRPVPDAIVTWFEQAQRLGFKLCMVSNNIHSRAVEQSAEQFGARCIHHAMKPLPFAVWRALRTTRARKHEAVLIGDQLFTDVLSGKLAGVKTILVRPQSTSDIWYTRQMRKLERRLLRNVSYKAV